MSHHQVVIIGGGPAGISAALELHKLGITSVAILDREKGLGGVPRHCHHLGFGIQDLGKFFTGPKYVSHLVAKLMRTRVELNTETLVTKIYDNHLETTSPHGLRTFSFDALLVATGCRERPRSAYLIAGFRGKQILTTGSLQQLIHLKKLIPGKKAIIIGAEHVSYSAVSTCLHAGMRVAAVLTKYPKHQSYGIFKLATAGLHGVRTYTSANPTYILGRSSCEGVRFSDLKGEHEIGGDCVIFSGGWIAETEAMRSSGFSLSVTNEMRLEKDNHFAAGNLVHPAEMGSICALDGRFAAQKIFSWLETKKTITRTQISVNDPIEWIFPNAIENTTPPPRGHFLLSVKTHVPKGELVVRTEEKILYRKSVRNLLPSRSLKLPTNWMEKANSEVNVTLEA